MRTAFLPDTQFGYIIVALTSMSRLSLLPSEQWLTWPYSVSRDEQLHLSVSSNITTHSLIRTSYLSFSPGDTGAAWIKAKCIEVPGVKGWEGSGAINWQYGN